MAHIQWKDRYNINFREIDAQHHGLLDLLNELIDLMDGRRKPDQVEHLFQALGDYALTHFSSEERYMQAAGYPKLAQHRQEHVAFVARVAELSQAFDPRNRQVVEVTLDFLKHWYLNHITKSDQDYVPFLKKALPTTPIEGILFALDGVICAVNPAPLVKEVAQRSGRAEAEVQAALGEDPGLLHKLEAGAWDLERFNKELTAWAGSALPEEDLARAYLATFQPVPALVQLAARLKTHQPVALVGNAAPWMRTQGFTQFGLEGHFSAEALSCEAGARLPDKAVLLKAAAKLGLAPETCLLIQRDAAGLDAAQAAHLQTLHYTNPVMLMAELRRMGLAF
jgi:HAD superfamily hydrolase (TIGR01509 family)